MIKIRSPKECSMCTWRFLSFELRHSFVIRHSSFVIPLMSVLVDKSTRLVVQGITGSAGAFHTRQCMDYGTNVVAGVTLGKGGQVFEGTVPVFDTVWEARRETRCNASMVLVPARAAADCVSAAG